MILYLLRHAIAVQRGTPGYENDNDRPLTGEGVKKMEDEAQGIASLDLQLTKIFTSPILRGRHTAEIVASAMKAKGLLTQVNELGTEFSCEGVLDLLRTCDLEDKVMLVGHEPDLSELASFLLIGRLGLTIQMKKGSLLRLESNGHPVPGEASLIYLLEPKHLRAMAKA